MPLELEILDNIERDEEEREEERAPRRRLTRQERLEAATDAGLDTWDDYNGEK